MSGYLKFGADGLPTDPAHPWNQPDRTTISEARAEFYARHMGELQAAWREGRSDVLPAALIWCHLHRRPLPDWLVAAIGARLSEDPNDGRMGRLARPAERDRQDRVHCLRWDAVRELRDRKDELKLLGYRPTWDAAYQNAAEALSKTEAFGSPDVMKRSYQLVERALRKGGGARFLVIKK